MNEIIFEIVRCVVVIAIMVLVRYAIPLLKTKVKSSNLALLYDWAVYSVKAAQQTYTGNGMGSMKKAIVKDFLLQLTKEYDVAITDAQLDNLIESAVYAMKQEDSK